MIATHRVKDSSNKTIGFIAESRFYTIHNIVENIDYFDNLRILKNNIIKSKIKLPEIQYRELNKLIYTKLKRDNPFNRDVQQSLMDWKNDPNHKVLQVEGARQVGKTTEIKKFAYKNYEYIIYVNLANDEFNFAEVVTKQGSDPLGMEIYCRKASLPSFKNDKRTILIIDEIQIDPKVYNSIRTLYNNLKCDILVTVGCLGKLLKKEYFHPMGTISYTTMFTLSFKEFCRAFKKEKKLLELDIYKDKYDDELGKLYEIYRKIGGYPDVITEFIKTKSIDNCNDVIQKLLTTFEIESRGLTEVIPLYDIFNCILTNNFSNKSISNGIQWLIYSGIIGEMSLYLETGIGHLRRIYFLDCGLANYLAKQVNINESTREGMLTETFAFSELYRLHKERYSKSKVLGRTPGFGIYNNYELDFIILEKVKDSNGDSHGRKVGIEVKTTKGDPKSLKVFLNKGLVERGILAKKSGGGHNDSFDTIPIYAIGNFPYN